MFSLQSGSCHADELFLMFHLPVIPLDTLYTEDDKKTSTHMLKLWTKFAETAGKNPSTEAVKWERIDAKAKEPKFLDISAEPELGTDSAEYRARLQFWDEVFRLAPPHMHARGASETWKNPRLHRMALAKRRKEGQKKKDEL